MFSEKLIVCGLKNVYHDFFIFLIYVFKKERFWFARVAVPDRDFCGGPIHVM